MVKCVSVKLVTTLCYLVSIVRFMSLHEFRYGYPVYQHDISIFLGLTTPVKILEFHQLWEFPVEKNTIFLPTSHSLVSRNSKPGVREKIINFISYKNVQLKNASFSLSKRSFSYWQLSRYLFSVYFDDIMANPPQLTEGLL